VQLTIAKRFAIGGAALALVVALARLWWLQHGEERTAVPPPAPAAAPVARAASQASITASVAMRSASSPRDADPLGHAADLRALHDRWRQSADPAERRVARRAFGTCIPAFLPPAGQAVSPEAVIRALPVAQRAEREAAWRDLFARCQRFGSEARDALLQENADWRRDKESADPGARAVVAARAGRLPEAGMLVANVSPADPASVDQLSGIATLIARRRDAEDRDLALRAVAVDTALPLLACDLGLACDAQSLRALELCAVEASCNGDVASRILGRPGIDPGLAEAAQRERERLLALIRANGKLSLADLLP
jgi:hypothetical protein